MKFPNLAVAVPGIVLAGGLFLACTAAPDAEVRAEVQRRISTDPTTTKAAIDVQVKDGVATLVGQAPNETTKDKAAELADDVDGVARVDNQIVIARAPAAPAR